MADRSERPAKRQCVRIDTTGDTSALTALVQSNHMNKLIKLLK